MCHKLDFANDVASALHDAFTEDWFFSWTDAAIADAVLALSPGQLRSTVSIARAIVKARPFTEWVEPKTELSRTVFTDICEAVDPLANAYARFLERQLTLQPLAARKTAKRPAKALPITSEQRRAMDDYMRAIAQVVALKGRDFPPNVVDFVQYRARQA